LVGARETLWRSARSSYLRVLPKALGVHGRRCSLPLQRIVCDFAMENSFRKANERMLEQHGFELPLSAIASESRIHAEKIACGQRAESREANLLPGRGANNIIAEADGSFVRIVSTNAGSQDARKTRKVDYQEVRLCAATAQGSREVFYGATFDPVDTVAPLWAQAAKRAGMALHSRVHVLADGAVWIDSQRVAAFGERGQMLIDLYHVLEYLGQAAESCSDNQLRWLKTQKNASKPVEATRSLPNSKNIWRTPPNPSYQLPCAALGAISTTVATIWHTTRPSKKTCHWAAV